MRHVDDRRDRALDVLLLARQLAEHPAREDLLERAIDDPGRERRLAIGAHLAALLRRADHPRQREEHRPDLVDALADLGAATDLPHEHADRVGRDEPRAEIDAREAPKLLVQRRPDSSIRCVSTTRLPHISRKIVSSTSSLERK